MLKAIVRKIRTAKQKLAKQYHTYKCKKRVASFKGEPKVNFSSQFTDNTFLGVNTHFNGMAIAGLGKVEIGDNFHSGKNCQIITDIHNFNGTKLPYDETYIVKDVNIGDNVWLGNNVIILGGVEIGEGCIIQAGSVVTKSIEPLSIAGGHPAAVFSSRDKKHYYTLKDNCEFH
jgi:acetyltransferase-like isoleucine patch superfamily enzyme